jgi:hypothetical protein
VSSLRTPSIRVEDFFHYREFAEDGIERDQITERAAETEPTTETTKRQERKKTKKRAWIPFVVELVARPSCSPPTVYYSCRRPDLDGIFFVEK